MSARRGGVQLEIVASLFVMMLAGMTLVAAVMVGLSARALREDSLERLRMGARHLERAIDGGPRRISDLAAIARASGPRLAGGELRVLDEGGREPGQLAPSGAEGAALAPLLETARTTGEGVSAAGFLLGDQTLVRPIELAGGERGYLVGRTSSEALWRRFAPFVASAAWVLLVATLAFVGFGGWLLRRRVVSPLETLSAATRRVAAGDLRARIAEVGPFELAELARAFNQMAGSLESEREARMRAQESLSRSRRLASVGQLAAGVAHEVGNPVAAILGYSEACARDREASPRTRELVERIGDEALRIRGLVREMLDLSRPDALVLEQLAPGALLARAAERMRDQPLLAGVALELLCEPNLPAVEVDARRVDQVLVNLIENAAHALGPAADRRIRLEARRAPLAPRPARRSDDAPGASFLSRRQPDGVALDVIDNGPGIDPEHLPHVFDPFFTTKEPGEGTGLGLWNAHRVAELLGGRLEVTSESGRTCFSLLLPAVDTTSEHAQASRAADR